MRDEDSPQPPYPVPRRTYPFIADKRILKKFQMISGT
jgi:hypothetical protein